MSSFLRLWSFGLDCILSPWWSRIGVIGVFGLSLVFMARCLLHSSMALIHRILSGTSKSFMQLQLESNQGASLSINLHFACPNVIKRANHQVGVIVRQGVIPAFDW